MMRWQARALVIAPQISRMCRTPRSPADCCFLLLSPHLHLTPLFPFARYALDFFDGPEAGGDCCGCAIGVPHTRMLVLQNISQHKAAWKVRLARGAAEAAEGGFTLSVTPSSGSLKRNARVELAVTLTFVERGASCREVVAIEVGGATNYSNGGAFGSRGQRLPLGVRGDAMLAVFGVKNAYWIV